MGSFSLLHWIVVLLIVMLVFGTKKLRNIGGDLGNAIKEFKEGMKETTTELNPSNTTPTADTGDKKVIDIQATEKK